MKFIGFRKLPETFAIMFYNEDKQIVNNYFIQFTFKEPWKYPHKESRFNNGSWLIGWGFLYVGNIIADGKEHDKDTDKNKSK